MSHQHPHPTAVELFCGAGGLALGLAQAGFRTVYATDNDKDCCASFSRNHAETEVTCADIHEIDFRSVRRDLRLHDLDLLAGGPPCQGFSTVGSKREQDPRNSLFFEFLRAIAQLEPRCVLFENVSGFRRMYEGRAFDTLTAELAELGYDFTHSVLNASDYGLPQHRLRTFVIGWQRGCAPAQLPPPTHTAEAGLFQLLPKLPLIDAISDLPPLGAGQSCHTYRFEPLNHYQEQMRKGTESLTEHTAANYGPKMQEILELIPPGGSVDDLPLRLRPKGYFANTYARLRPDEPAPTITRNFGTPSSSRCVHPFQNRALSTREGARLQGFPDSYAFIGSKGSKNLQIGNAVPAVMGRAISHMIRESLAVDATHSLT